MLQAAIYDMDGLLIDTEPLWQAAEKRVFKTVGIELTTEMCLETMGLRIDEVIMHWYERFPWTARSPKEVETAVLDAVAELIVEKGKMLPGVRESVGMFRDKGLKLAVASSSPSRLIETVLNHFGLMSEFALYRSAEAEAYGKPHPAVYISTAKALDVAPTACIALEDSFNGLLSCKSARMKTVIVPDPAHFDDAR
ncbi:MAG: hexitol phosphatase HxpB, partial [Bacteroidota bacterium]